jgi:hypothetical protein
MLFLHTRAAQPDLTGGCAFGPFGAPKGQRKQETAKCKSVVMKNVKVGVALGIGRLKLFSGLLPFVCFVWLSLGLIGRDPPGVGVKSTGIVSHLLFPIAAKSNKKR